MPRKGKGGKGDHVLVPEFKVVITILAKTLQVALLAGDDGPGNRPGPQTAAFARPSTLSEVTVSVDGHRASRGREPLPPPRKI